MAKYRKKPVVIDAVQFNPKPGDVALDFVYEHEGRTVTVFPIYRSGDRLCLQIETMEGVMEASPGDWIIRGIKGEFYPCKNDIFEKTYELVKYEK